MKNWVIWLCLVMLPSTVLAEAKKEGEQDNKVAYVSLYPPLVGNYNAGEKKLRYYKADISLRVVGNAAAEQIKRHDPLVRNQLVMLFAQQSSDVLETLDGKEQLRREALRQLQQLLTQETGKPLVDDLLFNNLVVQ
ncbi:flagellar FliL protein [Azomonas agilis]|uniref:Flagellar protein FliL n=1 Tax=Azomonas agilis TaxID=116849 RepID=A0A562IL95_9GAMM|nr:flagellar basal body-associated FliL family protein [Azomonas agilis]TWH71463.1 flagellar FliL protein [Azomonas agilis]